MCVSFGVFGFEIWGVVEAEVNDVASSEGVWDLICEGIVRKSYSWYKVRLESCRPSVLF